MKRLSSLLVLLTMLVAAPMTPAAAVPADTPVTIDGGGWGHGIGMSQFGARGMAEAGSSYTDILSHFYAGTTVAQLSTTTLAVPDPIKLGLSVSGENYDRTSISVLPTGGELQVCLTGQAQGTCTGPTAADGQRILVTGNGTTCAITRGATLEIAATSCDIHLYWANQPNVKIVVGSKIYAWGALSLVPATGAFRAVLEIPLDQYVRGLGEMPKSWPLQALKAQAVAARTYAAKVTAGRPGLVSTCSCHLRDTTADQVYLGWGGESDTTYGPVWQQAVAETDGEVVVKGGSVATTYYFSNSGGRTENVEDVWNSSPTSYLVTVTDPWSAQYAGPDCSVSLIRWCRSTTAGQIATAFGLDEVIDIDILARYASGSPSDIAIKGLSGGVPLEVHKTGGQFKTALGLVSHFVYDIKGFDTTTRLAGTDRYATAAAVSTWAYPGGASTVYVATGFDYPDALAGGAAAGADGAPLLLVKPGEVPAVTRREIVRLKPSRIVILGGTGAVSQTVEDDLARYAPVERRAGIDRFQTALLVSQGAFTSATTAYVATGLDFPDAMVAAPLAAKNGAPLLLVRPDRVPGGVLAELDRLGVTNVVIVGGTVAVSPDVEAKLAAGGRTVGRITGGDRYRVSIEASKSGFGPPADRVYVAVGSGFPDALAGAAASGALPGPLLLVQPDAVPAAVAQEVARLQPLDIVILGGTGVVSKNVALQLSGYQR